MFENIIDKISYYFYKNDKHRHLEDIVLPRLIDNSGFFKESIDSNAYTRCNKNRNKFDKQIKASGYSIPIEEVLKYYPINVKDDLKLLGEYVANTPFCQFLEPVQDNKLELVIKLDGNSTNKDLRMIGSIMKDPNGFKNIHLIFDYNPVDKINFLKLNRIYDCDKKNTVKPDDPDDPTWLDYLQSGYTEMTMVLTFQHALWHLMTAYITCVAKETIKDKNLVKVFKSSEQNIFLKAYLVKTFFLQSPLLFNTTIYGNPKYMNYIKEWINNFVDHFDIGTHFDTHLLRGLNPDQLWIPGFRENLQVVKKFSDLIVSNSKDGDSETLIWSWNGYKNVNKPNKKIKISKLIQILYTVGSVYHSNTFEYQKLLFTELIYLNHKSFYQTSVYNITLSTLDWKMDYPTFGDSKYYSQPRNTSCFNCFEQHLKYVECFENLKVNLKETRKTITEQVNNNAIFKPYVYTDQADKHFCINTWNTRV